MHLKVLILCCFLVCAIYSVPRRIDENERNGFVMIGNSNNANYKKTKEAEEKTYGHLFPPYAQHPLVLYAKPENNFGYQGFGGHPAPSQVGSNPLISANVLLEPFLLVTFLLFILSLLDKARVHSIQRRHDQVWKASRNFQRIFFQIWKRNFPNDF